VQEVSIVEPIPVSGFADPVSSLTHLGGAIVFAVLGVGLVSRARGNALRVAAVCVYVTGVVFALAASGVFHLVDPGTATRSVLQRVDHAGIFFLIASTYTPVHIIEFKGFMRWGVLAAVWGAAVAGIVVKSVFFSSISLWVGLSLYLGLGWAGLVSATALYRAVGLKPLWPLIGGALAYTAGAVLAFGGFPTVVRGVVGPHEIFHVFVLVGVAMHWTYIRRIVIYAPITDLYQRP
jgi:channel protein (hemolysin III family)